MIVFLVFVCVVCNVYADDDPHVLEMEPIIIKTTTEQKPSYKQPEIIARKTTKPQPVEKKPLKITRQDMLENENWIEIQNLREGTVHSLISKLLLFLILISQKLLTDRIPRFESTNSASKH